MGEPRQFYLRTLGQLALYGRPDPESGSSPLLRNAKSLAVLVYLAAGPNESVGRSRLATLLWPDRDPSEGRSSLRNALYYLKQRTGAPLLDRGEEELSLLPNRLVVDLWQFQEALEAKEWERAIGAYGGTFLASFSPDVSREFEHWAEARNEEVWSGLKAAYHRSVEQLLEEGRHDDAVERAEEYVELNPLDPTAHRAHIDALAAADRKVEALQASQGYRTLLEQELGEEVGDHLRERIQRLRQVVFAEHDAAGASEREEGTAVPVGGGERSGAAGARRTAGGERASSDRQPWNLRAHPLRAAAVLAALLALGALGWAVWGGPQGAKEESTARLFLQLDGGRVLHELRLGPSDTTLRATELDHRTEIAPSGDRIARVEPTPGGYDLAVEEADGPNRVIADRAADERPVDWAPDGSALLYDYVVFRDGGESFERKLAVHDFATDRSRPLSVPGRRRGSADWSPLGPWIAYTSLVDGNQDVRLVSPDGEHLRRLTRHEAVDRSPAWSPDGRALAFTSHRDGDANIYVLQPDGAGARAVTGSPAQESNPVWVDDRHVAFVSDRTGTHDLWLVRLPDGVPRPLTRGREVTAVASARPAGPRDRWVSKISMAGLTSTVVSPGQRLKLSVNVLTANGDSIRRRLDPLIWTSGDPGVVELDSAGRGEVMATGTGVISVTCGGWRSDSVLLRSRPLRARNLAPRLTEDWSDGLVEDRWQLFGRPLPYVRPTGSRAPGPAAFVNNGDQNYESGVVSRFELAPTGGVTVEFWARMPFTERLHEKLRVGLTTARPAAGDTAVWRPGRWLAVLTMTERSVRIDAGEQSGRVPLPEDPDAWHRYALQIDPEGGLWFVVDERLRWRSPSRLAGERSRPVHLVLRGRSWRSELSVGPVRVYEEARYCLTCEGSTAGDPA